MFKHIVLLYSVASYLYMHVRKLIFFSFFSFLFPHLVIFVVQLCSGVESNFISLAWLVYQLKGLADKIVCASR